MHLHMRSCADSSHRRQPENNRRDSSAAKVRTHDDLGDAGPRDRDPFDREPPRYFFCQMMAHESQERGHPVSWDQRPPFPFSRGPFRVSPLAGEEDELISLKRRQTQF